MNLNEAYKIILTELNIQKKKEISKGVGGYKKVFPLKTNPNYVVKFFDTEDSEIMNDIQKEIGFFKKYPQLYATLIKVDLKRGIMIQEKLNTRKVTIELDEIGLLGQEFFQKRFDHKYYTFDFIKGIAFRDDKQYFKMLKDFMAYAENDFLNNLVSFFLELNKIGSWDNVLDLKPDNIGIDKQGNIKLLDL